MRLKKKGVDYGRRCCAAKSDHAVALRDAGRGAKLLESWGEAVQRGHGLGAGPRGSEGRARRSRGAQRGELGKKELTCGTDGSASERGSGGSRERAERLIGGPSDRG